MADIIPIREGVECYRMPIVTEDSMAVYRRLENLKSTNPDSPEIPKLKQRLQQLKRDGGCAPIFKELRRS